MACRLLGTKPSHLQDRLEQASVEWYSKYKIVHWRNTSKCVLVCYFAAGWSLVPWSRDRPALRNNTRGSRYQQHTHTIMTNPLQWRHNERDSVSNKRRLHCLLNCWLFRPRSKKTSKPASLAFVNSPVTGEFPAQKGSDAENASIWWRHHTFK